MIQRKTYFLFRKSVTRLLVFFLPFVCADEIQAQAYHSTNPDYLKTKGTASNLLSSFRSQYPDTTVDNAAFFAPRNSLGSAGLSSAPYFFKYGTPDLGFIYFRPPTPYDWMTEENILYMRTVGPYANLNGIIGMKNLQSFRMIFSHTYKDKVNISLSFNRYTNKGQYKRQQAYTNNLWLTSNYQTKNRRFGYYCYILSNGIKNNESGGLADGHLTDTTAVRVKEVLPINITEANRQNKEIKAEITPWFRLNKRSDSTHRFDQYIQIRSKLVDQSFHYRDKYMASDDFYSNIYLDSTLTNDSAHVRQYLNGADITLRGRSGNLGLTAGYLNEVSLVWQRGNAMYTNHIAHAELITKKEVRKDSTGKPRAMWENLLQARQVFSGYNQGDQKIENNSVFYFANNKKLSVNLDLLYENRRPDQFFKQWTGNNFIWKNDQLKSQQQTQLKAGLRFGKRIGLNLIHQRIKNYLYFDSLAMPAQHENGIVNTSIQISYTQVFFKHLGVYLDHIYQTGTGGTWQRYPSNVTTGRLFYSGNLFRNNLQLQTGGQLQVFQSFTPYNYMPATQVFYLQNKVQTGSYPYVDFYLSARIRPVTFFFKIENLLQHLGGNNYFLVPGYYQPERAWRMGISWMFFD